MSREVTVGMLVQAYGNAAERVMGDISRKGEIRATRDGVILRRYLQEELLLLAPWLNSYELSDLLGCTRNTLAADRGGGGYQEWAKEILERYAGTSIRERREGK